MGDILKEGTAVTNADKLSNVRTDDLLELIEDMAAQLDALTKLSTTESKHETMLSKWGAAMIGLLGVLIMILVGWLWQRINVIDDRQVVNTKNIATLQEQEVEDRKDSEHDRIDFDAIRKQQEDIKTSIHAIEIMLAQEGWNPTTKKKE